ncbi:MAG: YabP/YqfC family sporulation protein [Lachnospiraceae bacterium]|nr:YabP/YqfC family sporulation protein [Lachnospiraceae bacterium]
MRGKGKENLVRALQLPEDYRKGRALVHIEGREHVCVENFKGICSYTAEEVSLAAAGNQIRVSGKRLRIDCYTKDEIEISGLIETVTYLP